MKKTGAWRRGSDRGFHREELPDGELKVLTPDLPERESPECQDSKCSEKCVDTNFSTISGERLSDDDKEEDETAAEIREAHAILEESRFIRNSIRDLMLKKVTGEKFIDQVSRQSKEAAPPNDTTQSEQLLQEESSRSGLDELLDKREAKVSELRDHMTRLQAASETISEDNDVNLLPSDFTKLVDELFRKHKKNDAVIEGGLIDKVASSTKIHEAIALAFAMDNSEKENCAGSNLDEIDERLLRGLEKIDKLDRHLAKSLKQAEELARAAQPERYEALDRQRREKLEKRVNGILERDRKEKLRQLKILKVLDTPTISTNRLTAEDEALVEAVMSREEGDDLMMNPYDEIVDDEEMSETMTSIMQAIESRCGSRSMKSESVEFGVNDDDNQKTSPSRHTGYKKSPSKSSAQSLQNDVLFGEDSIKESSSSVTERKDYLSEWREAKILQQNLKEIDAKLIKLKTSAYPEKLDEKDLRMLLNDGNILSREEEEQRKWKIIEEGYQEENQHECRIDNEESNISEEILV